MAVSEPVTLPHGDTESEAPPSPPNEPNKTNTLSSLGRQSSIYSLTLDEFQNTLCEDGKNFGSMNMDEFLTNIWNAEENQLINSNNYTSQDEPAGEKPITTQTSLRRQGSLSLPAPLCRKTVEEVWSEIHKGQQQPPPNEIENAGTTQRQPTLGEMTLEDFLIRAGVVREACGPSSQHQASTQQQYAMYRNNNTGVDPNFGMGAVMGMGFSDHLNTGNGISESGVPAYQAFPQSGGAVGESSNYGENGKRNGGYPGAVCYTGRVGNGSGYGAGQTLGMGSPVSPVSSEGIYRKKMENSGSQYGLEMGGMRGRKRIIDGPVEKVVERRQRRMIKNRESAARSRARKQAYTVELEAELNQLKDENARLKQILAEAERKRRQELQEEMKEKAPTKAQKNAERFRLMRRTLSWPW
ncbi:hypothetical protein HHK36_011379 [Tetracentron sinense]|uniref:BZIP domain-containing protein n=1 Tax=Tetracentron sinense TaxID=13715 RepID=A0A835DJU3_TETSI|nr:hypothetical protein HHK36_011379 [Tetracentron sinense]